MTDFKELASLIDFLRKKGVVSYKREGVELVLLSEEPKQIEDEPTVESEEGPKRGADGLTAKEQEDLYGAAIDAGK